MAKHGHCLCGAVSWQYQGAENWSLYCHCESCRRATSSPVAAFIGVPSTNFRWTGAAPATFKSSPAVTRSFCGTCGAPMAFEADHYPTEIYLYAASLENPQNFRPAFHVHRDEKLPWLALNDTLPDQETD